jgi:hypothetical protein
MRVRSYLLAWAMFSAILVAGAVRAGPQESCNLRLAVELTPDVPNPRDPGFLGSLLADPVFHLTWVRNTDSGIVVDLGGPGPSYRCKSALRQLKRNTHVLDVKIVKP